MQKSVNKARIYAKIKFKTFLVDLLFELILNGIIFFVAYLCDKLLITALFYIPFHLMRYAFPKIFHARNGKPIINLLRCIFFSCICYFSAMKLMIPLNISIFSSVVVGVFINYCLYKIQDYIELQKINCKTLFDLCKMSEDELRAYAQSKGLSEMIVDTLVLRVIHNYRWVDIQKERNYTREGIKYHKQRINKVLNIKL